jgi:hypothetical protein
MPYRRHSRESGNPEKSMTMLRSADATIGSAYSCHLAHNEAIGKGDKRGQKWLIAL